MERSNNPLCLFNTNYAYRLKTHSIFSKSNFSIYDVFILENDAKLQDFNLFQNFWHETLLMNSIDDPRLMRVVDFGQLPQSKIYRQIEEVSGITLETYI